MQYVCIWGKCGKYTANSTGVCQDVGQDAAYAMAEVDATAIAAAAATNVAISFNSVYAIPAIMVLISTPAPPNRVSINTFAFGRCPSTHAHMLYSYSCSYNDFGAPASSILYANLMMGGLHFMHKWLRVDLFRTAAWIDTWTRWRNITNLQKWKSWGKTR